MMTYDKNVDVNPDGHTARCSRCDKDKPLDGFIATEEYYALDRFEPPEPVQICKDCQDAETEAGKEMEEYYGDGQS